MGMDMRRITVGTHLHLIARPSLGTKFHCDFMCLFRGQFLFWMKGLGVVIKSNALVLTIGLLGSHEFGKGILAITVDATDQAAVSIQITNFLLF